MKRIARTLGETIGNRLSLPAFLCPALLQPPPWLLRTKGISILNQKRQIHVKSGITSTHEQSIAPPTFLALPLQCPGCGAYTQSVDPNNAGFYNATRKSVKNYLARQRGLQEMSTGGEGATFKQVTENADPRLLEALGLTGKHPSDQLSDENSEVPPPVCNRCHDLLHHHAGVSIVHPTLQSIQDIISESPYKHNHIYHVLDAADFPLSFIPRLHHHLSLTPQRSFNRRAKKSKYSHGRKAEMSFIITRSDLLAPRKEQVDSLMPYLTQVLRDALGSSGRDVRLGNVRCVSSKRGWWTKQLKDDVWERGGGGWMVGKVNVGKSNLFECIFPKGRSQEVDIQSLRHTARLGAAPNEPKTRAHEARIAALAQGTPLNNEMQSPMDEDLNDDGLLPPAPREERFPVMPIVSSLPGTTASPIRLLFGGGKGELIDLPGLARGDLEEHVSEEHKQDLVMRQRVKPEQYTIKSGHSLLLGGLIRITPTTPDIVVLAYPFIPLSGHVTSTDKAIAIHTQQQPSGIPSIAKGGVGDLMASAGRFRLRYDVTKQRAGPLTAPAAVGLKAHVLPFIIYSIDILIEGCGWVELVVQTRRKAIEVCNEPADGESTLPEVEVFSPLGKYVGYRRPMNGWLLGGDKPASMQKGTSRPRTSMKGVKKNEKRMLRAK